MVDISASLSAVARAVTVVDGKPTTTSLDIARRFAKRHNDVLRLIRNLLEQLPSEHQRNFAQMVIETPIAGARNFAQTCRKDPAYRITRDGFTLLAMGFTGNRALQFKLAYIDAFNKMEAQLSTKPLQLPPQSATASQVGAAMAAGWAAAGLVQQDISRAVMNGGDDWKHQRYLLSFITDSKIGSPPTVDLLPADAIVMTQDALSKLMADVTVTAWHRVLGDITSKGEAK